MTLPPGEIAAWGDRRYKGLIDMGCEQAEWGMAAADPNAALGLSTATVTGLISATLACFPV